MAPNETRRHSCSQHRPKPHLVSVHRSAGLGNARLWAVLRQSHSCGGAIAMRAIAAAGIVQAVAGVGTVVLMRDDWDKAEFPREREVGSRERRRQPC